ncbi:MAG: UDP-N-acetylmuramoyl-L-alanyl-D-glutamate--2,6-diaminopimelate ligase [Candidatus Paceibacterota bacterium]
MKSLKIQRRMISTLAKYHFFGNPSSRLKIVGVTGTNGKTTTATLLYEIATALGYKAGLIGTVENIIIKERREALRTTPNPINLNKLLTEMVEKGGEYVFMEVSSHALDQDRVAGVTFVGGIFTNLTHDHLDYHGSFENYFKAKKKFFEMLPKRAFALSNIDDERGVDMCKGIKAHPFFYGFAKGDFEGEIKKTNFNGLKLAFNDIEIHSNLLGKFNAYNLLGVWSACSLLDFDMPRVNKIIESIEPPRGRFEHFVTSSGVLVIVDYAHTPDALENVLKTAREINSGIKPNEQSKIISIVGCGGDRDPIKRPIMGKIGAELSDICIFTSDNPRSEDPEKIILEMKQGLSDEQLQRIKIIPDRREAIKESIKLANNGDIILCAGKGHETYQEIKGVKHHFDDMEELKKALN